MNGGRVGVVGASARAAAMSLARAGYSAWAVDLFADRDLRRIAECVRCPLAEFPAALPRLAERFPPGLFLYTGGLENYPDIVGELMQSRIVWGNVPAVLRHVRDPFRLGAELARQPRQRPELTQVPEAGRWLVKSLRSSGGLGVRFAHPGEIVPRGSYLQEFIDGPALSAVFCGPQLLGITEQIIGEAWLHAGPFHYAGSIGPIDLTQPVHAELVELGERLAGGCRLRGIYGADFVWSEGLPWVVEINPRYTASLEVLEHALGFAPLSGSASRVRPRPEFSTVGKAIYFAPRSLRFPNVGPWDADLAGSFDPWRLPAFADIPEPGESIDAGTPVLTFFATGSNAAECRQRLQSRAAELDRLFATGASP